MINEDMKIVKKEIKVKEWFICHLEKLFHFANSQTKNRKVSILQIANNITNNVSITMRSHTWRTTFLKWTKNFFMMMRIMTKCESVGCKIVLFFLFDQFSFQFENFVT